MKTTLKNVIVPHKGNDFKPSLLSHTGLFFVFMISVALFFFAAFQHRLLFSDQMLSTIYPNLVATLSNKNRQNANLNTLTYNPKLEEAARLKAEDMMIKGYFAHVSPDGTTPWHWIKEAGYNYRYAGENLAINFSDSSDVTDAWMKSPSHRANILSSNFTEIGVATVKGFVAGRETVFVVEMFGKPLDRNTIVAGVVDSKDTLKSENYALNITSSDDSQFSNSSVQNISTTTVLGIATDANELSEISKENSNISFQKLYSTLSFMFSNPRTMLFLTFGLIVIAILLSITLSFVYLKRHYVPRLFLGFSLVVWILGLMFAYMKFFSSSIIVAQIFSLL